MPRPTVLGPVRHACFACGGGCYGTDVVVAEAEREPLTRIAADLGIDDPFDGPHLRKHLNGLRCVFLGDDQRCRIHSEVGYEAKPLLCRQYPLVAVQAGIDVRLAVDPGCLYAWKSFPDGPDASQGPRVLRSRGGAGRMAWRSEEAALIAALEPEHGGIGRALHVLSNEPVGPDGLPPGVVRRLAERLVASKVGLRVAHPNTARTLRVRLALTSAALVDLDPQELPAWKLSDEMERWAVEAARRMVFLRLPPERRPLTRALAVLAGALAAAWADPDPEHFGPALAAWTRVIRTPAIDLLLPDEQMLRQVLDGPN